MNTVVTAPETIDDRRINGVPKPQIIDHHQKQKCDVLVNIRTNTQTNTNTYDSIIEQRDTLIASEIKYKKRIKELEQEHENLLKVYEPTRSENEVLRSHVKHGPNAQKIKQLQKDKKEILGKLEIVKEENGVLSDRVHELEKMFVSEKNYYLEKKWHEAVVNGRKRREERDAGISTQGPFADAKRPAKRNLKTVKDEEFEKQDADDLHIDNLEKETQVLLNKIRQTKQNKEDIDYAHFIGKGAVTRNATIAKAISVKLERDVQSCVDRLDHLRKTAIALKVETRSKHNTPKDKESTDDQLIHENHLKSPHSGNKYFRSKLIQTDSPVDQKQTDIGTRTVIGKEIHKSRKDISEAIIPNTGTNRQVPIINDQTTSTTTGNSSRHSGLSNSKTEHGDRESIASNRSQEESKRRQNMDARETTNNKIDTPQYEINTAPLAAHWDQLAVKLSNTEKYRPHRNKNTIILTHRDIKAANSQSSHSRVSSWKSVQTNTSKLDDKETKRSPMSASTIKSESNIAYHTKATHSTKNFPANAHTGSITPVKDIEVKHIVHDKVKPTIITDAVQSTKDVKYRQGIEIKLATPRKTTHMGEVISYVSKNHSWETRGRVKHSDDNAGRYSNGPEPIKWRTISDTNVRSPEVLNFEKQRENTKKNNGPIKMKEIGKTEKKTFVAKTKLESKLPKARTVCEYDEVLADINEQYTISRRPNIEQQELKNAKMPEITWQHNTRNEKDEQQHFPRSFEFRRNSGTVDDKEMKRPRGNSEIRYDHIYNLDLL